MPNIRILQRSFSGGEVGPDMYGRIDDVKYQSGLSDCTNFLPKPQGALANRPGFAYVNLVKTTGARLIPFTYSVTQTMVIELGAGYFRFHTNGATLLSGGVPYEVSQLVTAMSTGYDAADLFDIHYVQSNDVMTLVHPDYPPMELRRVNDSTWSFVPVIFDPAKMTPPITPPQGVAGPGTPITHTYRLAAVDSKAREGAISADKTGSNDLTLAGSYNIITFHKGVKAVKVNVYKLVSGQYCFLGSTDKTFFVDTGNLTPDTTVHPSANGGPNTPTSIVVTSSSPTSGVIATYQRNGTFDLTTCASISYVVTAVRDEGNVESVQSASASCSNNLLLNNNYNTISWTAVGGADRYNVYKLQGGTYGYIGQTKDTAIVDNNIAPDLSKTPPNFDSVFQGDGDYPGTVSYYDQRRCFAGTYNEPQKIWMTKSGTESVMSYTLPVHDDDRIAFRVAARETNMIRHIVPLTQLLLLTASAEWRISPVNSDVLTPSTISVKPQSYVGANNVQPQVINNTVIYAAARGGHVREMAYNWQSNGFVTGDLSLRANHLFDGHTIVDMAYQKAPIPIVWFVRDDGVLLSLTYVPEQQVGAWAKHTTNGLFKSCCVVAEGNEDRLYCVIDRAADDVGGRMQCIEEMQSITSHNYFVDCGFSYSGAATTTISGLGLLNGMVVSIVGDGAVFPNQMVVGGHVTLPVAVSTATIGLGYQSQAKTLPIAAQIDSGFGQGHFKNINKLWMRVISSSGIKVGPDYLNYVFYKQRDTERYGKPPDPVTDEIQIVIPANWNSSGEVAIMQLDPLPLTLVSMTAEVALGG